MGHLDAERPAPPQPRREPRARPLWLRGAHSAPRGPRADDRVVPRARRRHRRRAGVSSEAAPAPAAVEAIGARLTRARELVGSVRPAYVLGALVAWQWVALLALAVTVRHNGWLY